MDWLSTAIAEAANATTLETLGERAFPALARALDAAPAYIARTDLASASSAIGGEHCAALAAYLERFLPGHAALRATAATTEAVVILNEPDDAHRRRDTGVPSGLHRPRGFEHLLMVRCADPTVATACALLMALSRDGCRRPFGDGDKERAALAVAAFEGAARRIHETDARRRRELAARFALTRAESDVLEVLARGASNEEIAKGLHVSVPTVKTHVAHLFRKLGVSSRNRVLAMLR